MFNYKMRSLMLLMILLWHHLQMTSTIPNTNPANSPSLHSSDSSESTIDLEYDDDDDDVDSDDTMNINESHQINNNSDNSLLITVDGDENDFCSDSYVDAAYFNGYDTILTRGDRLWYYYKDRHSISRAFDQRRFTQGDHIQGAFNISRTPYYCLNRRTRSDLNHPSTGPSRKKVHYPKHQLDSRILSNEHNTAGADCVELQKLRSMAVYFLHNKDRTRSYYNLDVRHPNGTQRRVRSRELPWNMKQVGLLGGNLWPNGWETYQQYRPVAYLPSRFEMIFILNHQHSQRVHRGEPLAPSPILTWNNLDANNWNTSWRSKVLQFDPPVLFTGMFEMNGIIYAIGEENSEPKANTKRIGKMFRYYITENDERDFKKMNQTVQDFFGCPKFSETKVTTTTTTATSLLITPINDVQKFQTVLPTHSSTSSTSIQKKDSHEIFLEKVKMNESNDIEDSPEISEIKKTFSNNDQHQQFSVNKNREQKNSSETLSVFLRNSRAKITSIIPNVPRNNVLMNNEGNPGPYAGYPKLASYPTITLRETDSIMLTILIAIVIGASILCIVLACLVINGKKRHLPHFEGVHRFEPAIPKPTIIGLDYHRRKNSTASSLTPFNFLSRYDSMNSLTAIYSQVHHHPTHRNRLSPMTEPSASPNLHALHPPPPPPLPSCHLSSMRNYSESGVPILHNKSVSVNMSNITKHSGQQKHSTSAMINNNNSNSVPNLISELNIANQNIASSSNYYRHHQYFNNAHNRIKSFERFENLI